MNWADYVIVLIIIVSALISLWRGFLREVVSLVTWVVGFWVALRFAAQVGDAFKVIHNPSARVIIGFTILFVSVLIVGMLVNLLISKLMAHIGAGASDRTLGAIFGVVRGVVVVAVLVIMAGFTALPRDPWWRESRLIPYAQATAGWMRGLLPGQVADRMMSGLKAVAKPRYQH